LRPTSFAAIQIARWYSEQKAFYPDLSPAKNGEYGFLADDYLKKADAASVQEAKEDPTYLNSTRYLVYRYGRAVVIGRLAGFQNRLGPEYQPKYRAAYEEFIDFAETQENVIAREYVLYSRMFYAQTLLRNKDEAATKQQLDLLAQEILAVLNVDTTPSSSVFLRFLRNEYKYRSDGATWKNLVEGEYKYSPNFKAAIEKVLAVPAE
jgi:hypothetical protein